MKREHVNAGVIFFTCVACYLNSLRCGFVFDDMSAVKENKDLRPHTPIMNLFWNDFWGTAMHKEQSHKSYRPLCVLTFRLNYAIHGLEPMGYHLVNVILHGVVSVLYFRFCQNFLSKIGSFVAAMLFAVHPIHTEAVTGVVGRAEILSSLFFITSMTCYLRCNGVRKKKEWNPLLLTAFFATVAMLCKEQGVTVLGVCCIYEVFIARRMRLQDILNPSKSVFSVKASLPTWFRDVYGRLAFLVSVMLCLVLARVRIMGAQLPVFTRFDNPASVAPTPVRQLTYNYLCVLNAWLLCLPCDLCCDWTMGTIPLLDTLWDARLLAIAVFYVLLIKLGHFALAAPTTDARVVTIVSLERTEKSFSKRFDGEIRSYGGSVNTGEWRKRELVYTVKSSLQETYAQLWNYLLHGLEFA